MSLLKNWSQELKRIDHPSPNFSDKLIPVEYVVIHYTACSLERTLEIFSDREKKVCAHFVLAENGDLYDLGNFYSGPIRQGAHAGETFFNVGDKTLRAVNEFSIGIEIVNLNGNVFPFWDAQYESLKKLMLHLKNRFPRSMIPIASSATNKLFQSKHRPGSAFPRWPASGVLAVSKHEPSKIDFELIGDAIMKRLAKAFAIAMMVALGAQAASAQTLKAVQESRSARLRR
jgi:N-acetyl-anhydromuramyl-L-alanine amidase AmpD